MKEYLVIEQENSKYKKDVPYITKKEFKKIENSNLVGATVLKEYDEDTNSDKYGILNYNEEQYRYKEKYFGWKKGYISVDNNDFIILKTRIPFLLLFLFLFLLLLLMFFFINPKEEEMPVVDNTPVIEEKIPAPPKEEKEEPKQEVNTKPSKPSIQKPKEEKYLIKYDANGGYGKVDAITCIKGKECLITENTFSKDGHTFEGWALTKDGDLTYDSKSVFDETNLSSSEITLYAKWKVNEYKILFIDYDETILSEQILTYDSIIENIPEPTRIGYVFDKWDNKLKKVSEDITYKATYKISNYNISFELNGGLLENEFETYNVETETFTLETPIKTGYIFTGWTGSNGSVPQINLTIEKGSIGERNYTANWKVQEYKITYNLNGGTASSLIVSYNIESNTFTLPTPTRTGYTFEGWSGTGLNGLTKSVSVNKGNIGDRNYTANWKVIDYTITYDLAGGSVSSLVQKYNVETSTFTLPTPTKTGYTFTGWTGTDVSSASKNVSVNKGSIGNRNYKANWNANYYTVNYYVEGSLWATRQVAYNTTPENLNAQNALDIYHKFNSWDGWVDKMPTNTVNLYANITESYCMLMTGHGPYGNAEGLLNVFKSAGWTGRIEEAPSAPGFYWVVTDYTLTRAQADIQREYIANHTNYTNYNFPYLYWVSVSCTNGIGDTWTRSLGTKKFTSQY